MSDSVLDQCVKSVPPLALQSPLNQSSITSFRETKNSGEHKIHHMTVDALHTIPSSPAQIYLNLLILEASLRAQYLGLRARRRQHLFIFALLGLWITYFFYALFLRPREDGKGVGGSPYWVVDMAEKVALMGGIVTGVLIWGTGQWERGFRWPRRWIGAANRGLRGMNCKIVVLKGPWWIELFLAAEYIFPFTSMFTNGATKYRYIYNSSDKRSFQVSKHSPKPDSMVEEDIAPGGNCIKLLLLPKYFSPTFRENWEVYRSKYWDCENERRAQLRKITRQREWERARAEGSWSRWTRWRDWSQQKVKEEECYHRLGHGGRTRELSKLHFSSNAPKSHNRSVSRSSSRTLAQSSDRDLHLVPDGLVSARSQRESTSTDISANERRRKKGGRTSGSLKLSGLSPTGGSRPVTPSSSNDSP